MDPAPISRGNHDGVEAGQVLDTRDQQHVVVGIGVIAEHVDDRRSALRGMHVEIVDCDRRLVDAVFVELVGVDEFGIVGVGVLKVFDDFGIGLTGGQIACVFGDFVGEHRAPVVDSTQLVFFVDEPEAARGDVVDPDPVVHQPEPQIGTLQ